MPEFAVRCSSLPVACACPQAVRPPAVKVDTSDASARVGTAVHAVLGARILGEAPENDVQLAAAAQGVDPDEVGYLVFAGWKYWRERLAELFPLPTVETEPAVLFEGGVTLTGHIDLRSELPEPGGEHAPPVDQVRIADWFTGWSDAEDKDLQVRGYCVLALAEAPQARTAYGAVVRLREATIEGRLYDRAELSAWWGEQVKAWTQPDPPYRPGRWCARCPRVLECPAAEQRTRFALRSFAPGPEDRHTSANDLLGALRPPLGLQTSRLVLAAYQQLQVAQGACESAREQLRTLVELNGGAITDGERELVLLPQARREVVPGNRVLQHLRGLLDDQHVYDAMRLSLSKLTDAAREQAPRGEKKLAALELARKLDELGALVTTSTQRLTLRRVTPSITEEKPNGSDHAAAAAAGPDHAG